MADLELRRGDLPQPGDEMRRQDGYGAGGRQESAYRVINVIDDQIYYHPIANPREVSKLVRNMEPDNNIYPWLMHGSDERFEFRFLPGTRDVVDEEDADDDDVDSPEYSNINSIIDYRFREEYGVSREEMVQENREILENLNKLADQKISIPEHGAMGNIRDIISTSPRLTLELYPLLNELVRKILQYNLFDPGSSPYYSLESLVELAEKYSDNREMREIIMSNYPGRRTKAARG